MIATPSRRSQFQSRAARGATTGSRNPGLQVTRFNSRAREGRDFQTNSADGLFLPVVPIHAPARGATTRPTRDFARFQVFNSRARRGATAYLVYLVLRNVFNSRAREGATLKKSKRRNNKCFNSRAREGRDFLERPMHHMDFVSIHAPARGAT